MGASERQQLSLNDNSLPKQYSGHIYKLQIYEILQFGASLNLVHLHELNLI